VLRSIGFALAVALGALGVWLIVTGQSQRAIRLGALASLWALLIGTFVMFGGRRVADEPVDDQTEADEAVGSTELAPAGDAALQRLYETRMEDLLRREIQSSVSREMSFLRGELASLRNELLDKVGGQIALERIETTRIIGSDLEALQEEVRQLRERALLTQQVENSRLADASRAQLRPTPRGDVVDAQLVDDVPEIETGYRGRRRRDDSAAGAEDAPSRRGRHSPEGEELLARLLSRES
jgi:hypothetical protein